MRGEKLDRCAGSQIRAADADDHEHVGVLFDFFGSRLYAGEFLFVIIGGKIKPADEVVAEAGAVVNSRLRQYGYVQKLSGTRRPFLRSC